MALLANGCVCCSIANDLLYTIEALVGAREQAGQPPFRRIVLETSGLARPGPIIRSLGELAPLGMKVSILATCDAAAPPFGDATFDIAAAQLAAAGTIVLTKLDRGDARPLDATLAGLNPLAARVVEPDPARRALAAFTAEPAAMPTGNDGGGHPAITVMTARIDRVPLNDLLEWLENLAGLAGDRLLRLKGVLQPANIPQRLLFQAVGTAFSQPRVFPGAGENGLVLITHGLGAAEISAMQPEFPVLLTTKPNGPFAARTPRLRAT
jgi:G3E family GTPase